MILQMNGLLPTGPPGSIKQLTLFHSNMEILKFMMISLHFSNLLSINPHHHIMLLLHMIVTTMTVHIVHLHIVATITVITIITVVTTITVTILIHHTTATTTMITIIKTLNHGKII